MRGRGLFVERSVVAALSFMRESVFADECALRRGFLQSLDPRMKAFGTVLLLLAVLFSGNSLFIAGVYLLCLLLAQLSSLRLGFFLMRTWVFIPLFAFFIALPALFDAFTPGDALVSFSVAGFEAAITRQGVKSAVMFFARVLTSVSLTVLLALTTRHYALLKAFRAFRVPQLFVATLGMCYRYLFLFIDIVQNTFLSLKSRVGVVTSSSKGRRIVAWNIATLWQRSMRMQQDVYSAMLARGYSGEPKTLETTSVKMRDRLFVVLTAAVFLMSLWMPSLR